MFCSEKRMVTPIFFEHDELFGEILHDQGRQPLDGLVEEDQFRISHERPADGEHLLLAAAQVAAEVFFQLLQVGEDVIDLFHRPGFARRSVPSSFRADLQILAHRKIGEDQPVVGDVADSLLGDVMGGPAAQVLAVEHHHARLRGRSGP